MITHYQSAELQIRTHEPLGMIIPYTDFSIVIFKIGRIRSRTEVTPLSYDSIPEITVMRLITETEHDSIIELTPYLAVRTDGSGTIYLGSHPDNSIVTQGNGTAQTRSLHDHGILSYIYRTILHIQHGSLHNGTILYIYTRHPPGRLHRTDNRHRSIRCLPFATFRQQIIIAADFLTVLSKNIINILYSRHLVTLDRGFRRIKFTELPETASECDKPTAVPKRPAGFKCRHPRRKILIRKHVTGDKNGLLISRHGNRKLLTKIFRSLIRIISRQIMFPLFTNSHYSHPEIRDRTSIRQRKKILERFKGVEKHHFHLIVH
ncbi:hypothetical protein IMSAGC016_01685 [Muribaculaceae bacterium]|nr:hypothetical protein IMSAGC016_01685 [Muribaculaceae bacterium]